MTSRIVLGNVRKEYLAPGSHGGSVTLRQALFGAPASGERQLIRALDGVSVTIEEGERVGIIGPNGAGKSTLLHMLAGTLAPDQGTVEISGRVQAILTLGMVLREEATGRENAAFGATFQGADFGGDSAGIVEEIIAFSELGDFIERPVRTYSSGMKARLAFSMIAFCRPEILVIDEVLSVGDAHFSAKATRKMRELTAQGRIVVVVSHGLGSIVEMCTRCLWLEGGRIVQDGEPAAVVAAYEHAVRESDSEALHRKFGGRLCFPAAADGASLHSVAVRQAGDTAGADGVRLRAMVDTRFEIAGTAGGAARDLVLRLHRVDGTLLWEDRLSRHHRGGLAAGPFRLGVGMSPLLLGEGLYRLDAELTDGERGLCGNSAVFELVDEQGQIGGKPMLYHPPVITAAGRSGER